LGFSVRPETALINLSTALDANKENILTRMRAKLRDLIIPKRFESGPETGQWRKEILAVRRNDQLFPDILVPVDGKESGWYAVDQALIIAQRENGKLDGLYVVPRKEELDSSGTYAVKAEFERRSEQAGIRGRLVVTSGDISDEISSRAIWTDLVVTNLLHPPGNKPLDRLDSGFQKLVQQCPRPVLATPQKSSPLRHALLAYDGSPKAEEGLYLSAYFAGQWNLRLSVVTVFDNGRIKPETMLKARMYLEEQEIDASYFARQGDIVDNILKVVDSEQVDLIITGGYGLSPVIQVVLGSTVDQLLRQTPVPVLICR
jgi:nucleotide-binding universal stress UspA family protein